MRLGKQISRHQEQLDMQVVDMEMADLVPLALVAVDKLAELVDMVMAVEVVGNFVGEVEHMG